MSYEVQLPGLGGVMVRDCPKGLAVKLRCSVPPTGGAGPEGELEVTVEYKSRGACIDPGSLSSLAWRVARQAGAVEDLAHSLASTLSELLGHVVVEVVERCGAHAVRVVRVESP